MCASKIPVIVPKSENKRLTCDIVSMIGSLGEWSGSASRASSLSLFFRGEPLCCCGCRGDSAACWRFGCINAFAGLRARNEEERVTGFFLFFSPQRGRFTPGERGPEVASDARRRTAGYRRRCSLMRVTRMWWHQWPVSTATVCWQWNVMFFSLPFCCPSNTHRDEP